MTGDPIFERVSVRRYRDGPVEEEKVDRILRAAMAAPSGGNQQPWEFYVVRDRSVIEELSRCSEYSGAAAGAPVVIVPCARSEGLRFPEIVDMDMSAAVENILLEATEQGLGAVWMAVSPWEDRISKVRSALRIPDGLRPFALVPIGYPAEEHRQKDRYDGARVHRLNIQ